MDHEVDKTQWCGRAGGGGDGSGVRLGPRAANPDRDAYFGETHVHTSWSLDALLFGNLMTTPADAYKYFKGEPIKHPLGYDIKIDTPLDWAGVTDHSEYAGVIKFANEPRSPVSKLPAAEPLVIKAGQGRNAAHLHLRHENADGRTPGQIAHLARNRGHSVEGDMDHANKANEPGKFTAFCSYEWTAMPNNMNMHRNVFFKECSKVPQHAVQRARLAVPGGSVDLDGRPAQGG